MHFSNQKIIEIKVQGLMGNSTIKEKLPHLPFELNNTKHAHIYKTLVRFLAYTCVQCVYQS
jgi:hypothetical protein